MVGTRTASADDGHLVDAGGTRVFLHDVGEGPVLLCIHGGAPGAFGWGNFGRNVEALAEHFRVIVVDLPGYGRSDKPIVDADRNGFYARTMVDVLRSLGIDRAHILGMATGGAVAIRMAVDHAETVERLVLVSSAGGPAIFEVPRPSTASQDYLGGDGPTPEKMRAYLEQLVHNKHLITEDVVEQRYRASVDPDFLQQAPEGRTKTRHTPPDLWKRLDEISARTLIVWGRENRSHSFEKGVFMLSRIRHSQLHVFGECGLWVPFEKSEEFNGLVTQFLTAE